MMDLKSLVQVNPNTFSSNVDEELILFEPQSGTYFGSGVVGRQIWLLISGGQPISVATVCKKLEDIYEVEHGTCSADVLEFLSELYQRDLIQLSDPVTEG